MLSENQNTGYAPVMDPMIESLCPRMRADVAGRAGADKARFVHVFLACYEQRKIFGRGVSATL
jgi:hypothetical protein